jgi:hypothetical protein
LFVKTPRKFITAKTKYRLFLNCCLYIKVGF